MISEDVVADIVLVRSVLMYGIFKPLLLPLPTVQAGTVCGI